MSTRSTFARTVAAVAAGISLLVTQPVSVAAQKEKPVDRTGLDILCTGKGDVYSPPPKDGGLSTCLVKKTGEVITCDSSNDKCEMKRDVRSDRSINTDAMTLYMLRQLEEKVDALTAQIQALNAARK